MIARAARAVGLLRDHDGRPVKRSDLKGEAAAATDGGIRSVWGHNLPGSPDPARLGEILRAAEVPGNGAEADFFALAEIMEERDLHYLGVLQTRHRQVAQLPIRIEPASDSAADTADADFVRAWFERAELEDEIFHCLDAIAKGVSVAEIIWDTSERQWMPERIVWRHPAWFTFDRVGGERLQMRADETGDWTDLPPWKFIVHRSAAKSGIPVRGGIARIAAWSWMMKSYTARDWMRFAEAYGQPIRLGKYGPHATDADRETLWRAVRSIAGDAAAIVPDDMAIEFVGDSNVQGRADIYRDFVSYLDAQISIAVLGQTLTTQEGQSGSYSLGQVHDRVRADIEASDARALAQTFRRDLVIPMIALNFGPRKAWPKVIIERERPTDMALLSQALERLVPLGLQVRADEVRTKLGLEAPGPDDDLLAPPAAQPDPDADPDADPDEDADEDADEAPARNRRLDTATARALVTLARAEARSDDPIDVAADRLAAGWRPLIEPLTEPALRAAAESDSYDALAARLDSADLWRETDRGPLADALYRAIFAARISGAG